MCHLKVSQNSFNFNFLFLQKERKQESPTATTSKLNLDLLIRIVFILFLLSKKFSELGMQTRPIVCNKMYTEKWQPSMPKQRINSKQSGFAFDQSSTNNLMLSRSQIITNQITALKSLQIADFMNRCLCWVYCGATL